LNLQRTNPSENIFSPDQFCSTRVFFKLSRQLSGPGAGDDDGLARSAARLAQRSVIFSLLDQTEASVPICKRIDPPLLFGRLWRDTGCGAVRHKLLPGRAFEFSVERAILWRDNQDEKT
jgi:hypothetical protein